jgi:cytochrome bd-type quinol oxidase subunit 1
MHALGISFLVFALVVGGAFAGMVVRRARPDEHFNSEAKDTIRLAIGLVVTMTSLVLGMLVSSGKTYYDGQKTEVAELSAEALRRRRSRFAWKLAISYRSLSTKFGQTIEASRVSSNRWGTTKPFISTWNCLHLRIRDRLRSRPSC